MPSLGQVMKKIILTVFISLGVAGLAFAKGDAAAGQAKATTCAACHGATGISMAPIWPNLAGQGQRYLIKQITEIKDGVRSVPEMMPFVSGLTPQDIEDLAAFYASQNAPQGSTEEKYIAVGEALYRGGDAKKGIPACSGCHSPTGKGNYLAGFPLLAGQNADYLAKQLRDLREGVRANDGEGKIMRSIAEKMSNKEIDAVSHYISGLR